MKMANINKSGGISIITGSVLLLLYSILFTLLLPFKEARHDMTQLVNTPYWIGLAIVAFWGIVLLMFSFVVVYEKMREKTGLTGFFAFIFIEFAYLLQASKVTWEIFLYPVIASNSASAFLLSESIIRNSALVSAFRMLSSVTILTGVILLTLAIIRSEYFSKMSGILVLTGALMYGVGPFINTLISITGIFIFSVGCFTLGSRLIKD